MNKVLGLVVAVVIAVVFVGCVSRTGVKKNDDTRTYSRGVVGVPASFLPLPIPFLPR